MEDGQVRIGMKRVWSDGTSAIELSPVELVEKLAAIIPPPRANQVIYAGVLAGNAAWRKEVVPKRCADFPLPEMVRTLSLAAATARVLVASEGAEGEVQVREGVVVGVRAVREPAPGERKAASETGEAAMALLQAMEGGGYEVRFGQGAGEPLTLAVPRRARRR